MKRTLSLLLFYSLLIATPAWGAMADNLIAYWKLDEASGNCEDAHSSNDLTDTNTVGAGTGKIEGARDFEVSAGESCQIGDNAALSTGDIDFTFGYWINPESLVTAPTPLAKDTNSSREYGFYYDAAASRMKFYVFGPSSEFTEVAANNAGALSTGTWYYVVGWHDSTGNVIGIAVFGAGGETATTAAHTAGVRDGTDGFAIGGQANGSNSWDGLIDEVGFWKRVLSADDRAALYNSGNGCTYDNIIANTCGGGGGTGAVGPLNRRRSQ